MIQLHRLEGFYWVAKSGGYAAAARAFPYPITQPAVHSQVKKLEADLGLALFERVAKDRMQLTAGGRRLFDFVEPFFEGLPGVLRSIASGDFVGELNIRSAPMFLRQLIPDWIKRLHDERPGIRVHLGEMPHTDLALLRSGEADLLVDYLAEVPDDLASMRVATLRAFLVLPDTHRLAGREHVALSDLQDDTFVGYTQGLAANDLQRKALAIHGIAPRDTVSADTAESILVFVAKGLGFSLVPALAPDGPRAEGVVALPLEDPEVEFPVWAVWRKDTPENPLLDAALEAAPRA